MWPSHFSLCRYLFVQNYNAMYTSYLFFPLHIIETWFGFSSLEKFSLSLTSLISPVHRSLGSGMQPPKDFFSRDSQLGPQMASAASHANMSLCICAVSGRRDPDFLRSFPEGSPAPRPQLHLHTPWPSVHSCFLCWAWTDPWTLLFSYNKSHFLTSYSSQNVWLPWTSNPSWELS